MSQLRQSIPADVSTPHEYTPQHPLFAHMPAPHGSPDANTLQEAEGFMDRFKSAKTLRAKLKALYVKLGQTPPDGLESMHKKELRAALTALKKKTKRSHKGNHASGNLFGSLLAALR
tara:strand:- start:178 stop:528 length:351 start_codon:yes stop_codon:yes gene_type:complete